MRNVKRLKSWLGDRVEIVDGYYEHRNRDRYFSKAVQALGDRPNDVSWVVLIDPDIGIQPGKPDKQHICENELSAVSKCLVPGDILIVYQHSDRSDSGLPEREFLLRKIVGTGPTIERIPYPVVTFFKVSY